MPWRTADAEYERLGSADVAGEALFPAILRLPVRISRYMFGPFSLASYQMLKVDELHRTTK